jgi:E3 ubiquitin-protein ligase DOA10
MKENVLRGMIRRQIKSSLKEADLTTRARGQVGTGLAKIEKMAGVKMLKKALGQGTAEQQAAGLLKVIQAISGENPAVGKRLARLLMKGGMASAQEENYTPGVDDGLNQSNEAGETTSDDSTTPAVNEDSKVSGALSSRMGRVDKTQAMVQMKKMLKTRPATQQVDFVIQMVNDLELKDSAKKRLLLKMRQGLK